MLLTVLQASIINSRWRRYHRTIGTLIVATAILVVVEWWYGRSRWPFAVLLAYFVIMLLTTDMIAGMEWFNAFAIGYANM